MWFACDIVKSGLSFATGWSLCFLGFVYLAVKIDSRGPWVAPLLKRPIFYFSSGHNPGS